MKDEGEEKRLSESLQAIRGSPDGASRLDANSRERTRTEFVSDVINSVLHCNVETSSTPDISLQNIEDEKNMSHEFERNRETSLAPKVSMSLRSESLDSSASVMTCTFKKTEAGGPIILRTTNGEVAPEEASASPDDNVSSEAQATQPFTSASDGRGLPKRYTRSARHEISPTNHAGSTKNAFRMERQRDSTISLSETCPSKKKQRILPATRQTYQIAKESVTPPSFSREFLSPKRRRKKKYKKPKDMPRRPLSAYNIFFREERARILPTLKQRGLPHHIPGDAALGTQSDGVSLPEKDQVDDSDFTDPKVDEGMRSSSSSRTVFSLSDIVSGEEKMKIQQDTSSETIPSLFSRMGKTIADRWNKLSPNEKDRYKQLAAIEKQRYHLEMAHYNSQLIPSVADEEKASLSSISSEAEKRNGLEENSHHYTERLKSVTADARQCVRGELTQIDMRREKDVFSKERSPRQPYVQTMPRSQASRSEESHLLTNVQKNEPDVVSLASTRATSAQLPVHCEQTTGSSKVLGKSTENIDIEVDQWQGNSIPFRQKSNHHTSGVEFLPSCHSIKTTMQNDSSSKGSKSPRDSVFESDPVKSVNNTTTGLQLIGLANDSSQLSNTPNFTNAFRQEHDMLSSSNAIDGHDRATSWQLCTASPEVCTARAESSVVDQLVTAFLQGRQEQMFRRQADLLQYLQLIHNHNPGTVDNAIEELKRNALAAFGAVPHQPSLSAAPHPPSGQPPWQQVQQLIRPFNSQAQNHIVEALLSNTTSSSDQWTQFQGGLSPNVLSFGELVDAYQNRNMESMLLSLLRVKQAMVERERQQCEAALRQNTIAQLLQNSSSAAASPSLAALQLALLAAVASHAEGSASSSTSMGLGISSAENQSPDNLTNQNQTSSHNSNNFQRGEQP